MKNIFQSHELRFIAWFSGVFLGTVALLAAFGLLPSEFVEHSSGNMGILEKARLVVLGVDTSTPTITNNKQGSIVAHNTIYAENPLRIVIPTASVDINVQNPASTDVDYLDNQLTQGVVHYPGSGMPGAGNMFIFGHSTGFSVVQNQAYKAFNNIHTLKVGDQITVYSAKHVYTYKVRTVKKVDKDDTWVKFDGSANMLTLSTCDSFGTKADRYVVQADYVGLANIKQ